MNHIITFDIVESLGESVEANFDPDIIHHCNGNNSKKYTVRQVRFVKRERWSKAITALTERRGEFRVESYPWHMARSRNWLPGLKKRWRVTI